MNPQPSWLRYDKGVSRAGSKTPGVKPGVLFRG